MALLTGTLLLAQTVFSFLALARASSNIPSSAAACQKLKKRYPDQTLLQSSAEYMASVAGEYLSTKVVDAY